MQSRRERTTLAEKRVTFTEPIGAKTSRRLNPSATGEARSTLPIAEKANLFAHLNRCLRSHFFGPQCIKSQGGVAVCRASVGRSHEQSLLLRARCFHL